MSSEAYLEHKKERIKDAYCALNIVRGLYIYGLRDDFAEWLEEKFINNDSLTIEHGVLMACGAIDWMLGNKK